MSRKKIKHRKARVKSLRRPARISRKRWAAMTRKQRVAAVTGKKAKFKTSHRKYVSEVAARNRRAGIKKHGSASAAQRARREERARESTRRVADEAAWRAAFKARHGRAPTDGDWMTDFNYTWKDRYARAAAPRAPAPSQPSETSKSPGRVPGHVMDRIRKLLSLANNNSNPYEAAVARRRARELMARYGVSL